jgi:hypothetical protein
VHAPSSEQPLPLKLLRERAKAASIESAADAAAAASVTPDRAISGARAEQRAACAAQASECESSSYDRERSRRSRGGERHTRQGDQRCTRRAASGLCRSSLGEREQQLRSRAQPTQPRRRASHPTGRSAVHAPSSERPVPLKPPRVSKSSYDQECSRRSCGGERHTRQGDQRCTRQAASGLCRPSFRERARAASIESAADAAAAASVTPDRTISGARAEQRAVCAAQASEGESSSYDRERSRRSRGGERYTRLGDQRCTRRAASGLCRLSLRERARAASIESMADAAAAASVTRDWAISGARAEQRAACAAQASEKESSSIDRECSRRSCGGERHTRQGDQRCTRRAASGLCRSGLRVREQQLRSRAQPTQPRRRASHPTGRSAVHAPSSERPVPLRPPNVRAAATIKSTADAAAAASVTPDRAISGARAEQRAASAAQASEREQQLRSRAQPTQPRRRASHSTGRSAVHAPSSERPVPLKLPRESKSSIDRERSRRCCGGERHTRQGDQRCTRRAASSLCRSSLRKRARATSIESVADAAAAASVTPDWAISGARAEQRAACAAQASEREPE